MLYSQYCENNTKALPPELADLLKDPSIWTNDACYGYFIVAMQNAGYSREEIGRLVHFLHGAFDEYTPEEAERIWVNW